MWLFKPNDWQPVYISEGIYAVWNTIYGSKINSSEEKRSIVVTLYYSSSRNKYKIKWTGYNPTQGYDTSDAYINCVKKQIELQSQDI